MGVGKFLAVVAIGLTGCGSSMSHSRSSTSTASTVNSSAMQACLEKDGYNVSQDVPTMLPDVYSALTSVGAAKGEIYSPFLQSSPGLVAIGGSAGQGDAAIATYDTAAQARRAANAAQSTAEQTGEGPVQAGEHDNMAWYVWTNTAATETDMATCAG
jgi:hypothetical protein